MLARECTLAQIKKSRKKWCLFLIQHIEATTTKNASQIFYAYQLRNKITHGDAVKRHQRKPVIILNECNETMTFTEYIYIYCWCVCFTKNAKKRETKTKNKNNLMRLSMGVRIATWSYCIHLSIRLITSLLGLCTANTFDFLL